MTSDSDKEGMLQRKNDLDEGGRKVSYVLVYIIIYTYNPYNIHHLYLTNLLLPIYVLLVDHCYFYILVYVI